MAILDSDDFLGVDPAPISFAIRSSSTHPIVLGNDIRGTLHSILDSDDRLTDISGRRLEEGMIVYIRIGYIDTEDSTDYTYNSNTYYSYRVQSGDDGRTDENAGALPNSNLNWVKVDIEADDGKIYLQVDSGLPTETGTYVLTYDAGTETFKIVTHDSEHDSDVALNDAQVWQSVSRAGPNSINYESDVIFGSAIASGQIESEHIKDDVIHARHIDNDFLETIITTREEITGIIDSDGYSGVGGIANRLRPGTGSEPLLDIPTNPSDDQVLVYDSDTANLVWRPRDNVQVETVHGHFVSSGDVELSFIPDDSDDDDESEIQLNLRNIPGLAMGDFGSSTSIPRITTNTRGLVTSISEIDIDLAVIKDSDISFDSDNIRFNTASGEILIPRYTDDKVSAIIDSEFDITTSYITYLNTTFNKYTDSDARTAVGIVTADITNSRQLIFSTSGNIRTLEQFRDSESATPENIRTAAFKNNSDGTIKLTLTLVRFMPSGIDTVGIGGSQLAWDVAATGTSFANPGVGIQVDVNGDTQLTADGDPYISAIASISVNSGAGEITDTSTFTTSFGGGDPAADNTNYQIRAIVNAVASIKPTVSNIQSTDGGTATGTITLSQSDGTTTSDYTAESDNDLAWDLSWQDVGVDLSTTSNGYNPTTGETFLKTITYNNIDYSSQPTGLSAITSTAATGVAVSVASPDSDYIYLTVESSSNGVLTGGEVIFANPVDTATATAATINVVTSLTRPVDVTTNGLYSLSITSPFTLAEPEFNEPRFFIITDRAVDPDLAVIIDDSTTTGIDINIEADDSAVTGNIASLGNTWIGTGSTGSITISSGQPTSTIWFALPSNATQPTNFERSVFGDFDAYENVHGLRGLRPDAVLEDLIPDDISGFSTNYDGQEYRFYGIDIGGGNTMIRIY